MLTKPRRLAQATAAALLALAAPGVAGAETLTLKADHYLDVAQGVLVSPAVIIIEDRTIIAVNPSQPPATDRTVELPGLTLMPGLMDAHTHLTLDVARGWRHDAVTKTAGDLALIGAANAEKTLMAGFTTIRDLGAADFADVAIARAVEDGLTPGPHIIAAGHATGVTGGHCDITGYVPSVLPAGFERGIADSADEFTKAVRHQIKYGARVVKICATAGVMSNEASVGAQQPSLAELKAAADETHRHGLKIAAHAVGEAGVIAAAEAGVDSIEHGSLLTPAAAEVMKRQGAYLVPTLYLLDAIDPASLPPALMKKGLQIREASKASFRLALRAKLKIVFGTDAGVYPHGDNAREFHVRTQLGQSALEAVRSSTLHASALLDVPDRGQIKVGLLADLIAVEGDPLADVRILENVRFVMKEGRVYKQPSRP